jgi:hypothetical protein
MIYNVGQQSQLLDLIVWAALPLPFKQAER